MADLKITTADGLIEATIKAKQETYYLVTEDNLNSLKQKNILGDLFMLLASLAWGAYFSVVTTAKAIPIDPNPNSATKNILQALDTLDNVFFIAGIIFSLLAGLMVYISFDQVRQMKKSKLEVGDNVNKASVGNLEFLILSATYEWNTGQKEVTQSIKDMVANGIYTGKVMPETFGIDDPAPNKEKILKIHYKINGQERSLSVKDYGTFTLE